MPVRTSRSQIVLSACLVVLALLPLQSFAASIQAVQGEKVLLLLNGDSATEGDLFIALNPEGKRLGILKITKVRGEKAIAQIAKGRAEKNWTATPRGSSSAKSGGRSKKTKFTGNMFASGRMTYGALLGYAMDDQTVTISSTAVEMKGTGFSGLAFGDYYFTDSLSVRINAGVETFNTTASITSALCLNSLNCSTSITYINLGGLARFSFFPGSINPWVGGGASLLYPMSKSSNAVTTDSIVMTYAFVGAIGADIALSKTMFIPIAFEYGLYPSTSDVSTNYMAARGGLGFSF